MTRVATTVWAALQLPEAALARLSFEGSEALPSAFAVTAFAAEAVGVSALAISELTGYLMAAAVVGGVTRRLTHHQASTARLSLARTARALIDLDAPPSADSTWTARTDDDLADGIESTEWGPARRVAPPMAIDGVTLRWSLPGSSLGSAPARWRTVS